MIECCPPPTPTTARNDCGSELLTASCSPLSRGDYQEVILTSSRIIKNLQAKLDHISCLLQLLFSHSSKTLLQSRMFLVGFELIPRLLTLSFDGWRFSSRTDQHLQKLLEQEARFLFLSVAWIFWSVDLTDTIKWRNIVFCPQVVHTAYLSSRANKHGSLSNI